MSDKNIDEILNSEKSVLLFGTNEKLDQKRTNDELIHEWYFSHQVYLLTQEN